MTPFPWPHVFYCRQEGDWLSEKLTRGFRSVVFVRCFDWLRLFCVLLVDAEFIWLSPSWLGFWRCFWFLELSFIRLLELDLSFLQLLEFLWEAWVSLTGGETSLCLDISCRTAPWTIMWMDWKQIPFPSSQHFLHVSQGTDEASSVWLPKLGKQMTDVQRKYMHSTQTVPMLWNTSKSCLLKHQPSTQQRSIVHFQQCIYHEACNLVTSRPFMHFCSAAWQLPWCYFISSTHVFSAWMMSLIWTRFVRFFPAFVLRPKAATFNTYLFRHTSCNPYGRVMQSHSLSINSSHHLAT